MLIHNYIKIMYSNMGYLPGTPYHLISDKEMFEAFMADEGFFNEYYPCPCDDLASEYDELKRYIFTQIHDHLENGTELPAWIYSYMIMRPITFASEEEDIAYLCNMANIPMKSALAEFNEDVAKACYKISKKWIQKQTAKQEERPATMFGETHVTKSLRLDQSNILLDDDEEPGGA